VDAQKLREMTKLQFISENEGVAWTPGEDPQEESAR